VAATVGCPSACAFLSGTRCRQCLRGVVAVWAQPSVQHCSVADLRTSEVAGSDQGPVRSCVCADLCGIMPQCAAGKAHLRGCGGCVGSNAGLTASSTGLHICASDFHNTACDSWVGVQLHGVQCPIPNIAAAPLKLGP
jgi:hypothetical protein